jgi:hypothetical protein
MNGNPNEIVSGKETVVRRRGADWSFHLPGQHELRVDQEAGHAQLTMPMEGTTYELAGIEETDDEVIIKLGAELSSHATGVGDNVAEPGYRLPEIQEEFDRLRGRWNQAGLPPAEFNAYPAGATHEDMLRLIRRRLREVAG